MRPTVVIVDDHPGFRSSARALLEAEGFDVVGEADDGQSALAAIGQLRPRVVLLDVQLPDFDGFEVAERLAREADPPAVVLISTRGVSSYRRRLACSPARNAGAVGEVKVQRPQRDSATTNDVEARQAPRSLGWLRCGHARARWFH